MDPRYEIYFPANNINILYDVETEETRTFPSLKELLEFIYNDGSRREPGEFALVRQKPGRYPDEDPITEVHM